MSKLPKRAIEDHFPFEMVSLLAERESWRKEVYRPIYYIHKWWARRLGSVFRAIVISSCVDENQNIEDLFYRPLSFPNKIIFDPFMGSGPTIGESIKLGCKVIGRDINPVSYFMVSTAIENYSMFKVKEAYKKIDSNVSERIKSLYKTKLENGEFADVLYYFWVKLINCPKCDNEIELFKKRIFSKHAYPKKHPQSKAVCPKCGEINDVLYNDTKTVCQSCNNPYNPQEGNIHNSKVKCPNCSNEFKLIDAVRKQEVPPKHKMYAKLVYLQDGSKVYLPINKFDIQLYDNSKDMLPDFAKLIPNERLTHGHNTKQVLNYNYKYWNQMFNSRQLVALAILLSEINKIEDVETKKLFVCLFSGLLEFNNMFASFKGEGTGAVRHMFFHHILKPELQPIEANVWGTPKSSGSFSTLYKSRIIKALNYKNDPFELKLTKKGSKNISEKVFGINYPVKNRIASNYSEFVDDNVTYLSVGDSSKTDLEKETVDLVITDPPFFDNVHYSELADFFYVWIRKFFEEDLIFKEETTRSINEVQNINVNLFGDRLAAVFKECSRVLKKNGLLIFTYHHSKYEGWISVYRSIREAGFVVINSYPVKAEMSVSVPILKSKQPINFDLIIICKNEEEVKPNNLPKDILQKPFEITKEIADKLKSTGFKMSIADIKVILMGQLFSELSSLKDMNKEISILSELVDTIDSKIVNFK